MKILVLNGSPHTDGPTVAMVDAFVKGAQENGNEVNVVAVAKKNIAGCMACEYCHTKGEGQCIQKDDMQEVYPLLAEADAVVLASPVYYFGISGQLACAVHRFYAPMKPAKATKMALMVTSMSPGVYDGIEAQYKILSGFLGCEDMGIVTSNGDENKSEAKLAECYELGKKFA